MSHIVLTKFGGEIPRLPAHMLPEYAAREAKFCDFTHGYLAPLKQGFLIGTMSDDVKSIYTEDGIYFYTWATRAYPQKSPVMRDTYNRVYYIESSTLRVTTTAGMLTNGGAPTSSYKAGVPKPTVAPTLSLTDRTTLRDYPSATLTLDTWFEHGSVRYQETTATLTAVAALRSYTFNAPTRADTTPDEARVRATLKFSEGGKNFITVTMTAGGEARSNALPGGVQFTMTHVSGAQHRIDLNWGVAETRAYTYTCRNTWKEESAPSPPAQVSPTYIQDVFVSLTAVDFTGGYRPLLDYCTYRTMGASAGYLRIKESSDGTFTDTSAKASDVLGSLDSVDFEEPPALDALVRLANGSLAGYKGSTLYISEPYRPHTWQYQIPFPKNIRGICPSQGSMVVTTAEAGYVVLGSDPASMQPSELLTPQAGVSQDSMIKLDGHVLYASNDGFVSVAGTQSSLAQAQALFARDNWRARYDTVLDNGSLSFAYHDGALVATSSTHAKGFVLRTDESVGGQMTQFNEKFGAMFQLPVADTLYYADGADIYQFRGGDPYEYTWHSRDWIFDEPCNLGAGFLRCAAAQTVTVTLYIDGASWWTGTLGNGYFRLPSGRKGRRWSVKIVGEAEVYELHIARNMQELKRV